MNSTEIIWKLLKCSEILKKKYFILYHNHINVVFNVIVNKNILNLALGHF